MKFSSVRHFVAAIYNRFHHGKSVDQRFSTRKICSCSIQQSVFLFMVTRTFRTITPNNIGILQGGTLSYIFGFMGFLSHSEFVVDKFFLSSTENSKVKYHQLPCICGWPYNKCRNEPTLQRILKVNKNLETFALVLEHTKCHTLSFSSPCTKSYEINMCGIRLTTIETTRFNFFGTFIFLSGFTETIWMKA